MTTPIQKAYDNTTSWNRKTSVPRLWKKTLLQKQHAALDYHYQKCHSNKIRGIDCSTRGENFSDIATLRTHCRHQHKPVIRHNCDECPETFSSKSNRNRHLTEEHAIINFNVKRVTVDDLFSCDLCNFLSKRKYNLQQHKLKLHSNQSGSTSCDICTKTFKYGSNLRRH